MVFTFQPPFWAALSGYVAEMASAFLCAELGIVPTVRHADYLGAWLSVLREDSKTIFRAARPASKAADWLLAKHAAAQVEAVQTEATQSDTGERPAPQDGRLAA